MCCLQLHTTRENSCCTCLERGRESSVSISDGGQSKPYGSTIRLIQWPHCATGYLETVWASILMEAQTGGHHEISAATRGAVESSSSIALDDMDAWNHSANTSVTGLISVIHFSKSYVHKQYSNRINLMMQSIKRGVQGEEEGMKKLHTFSSIVKTALSKHITLVCFSTDHYQSFALLQITSSSFLHYN